MALREELAGSTVDPTYPLPDPTLPYPVLNEKVRSGSSAEFEDSELDINKEFGL